MFAHEFEHSFSSVIASEFTLFYRQNLPLDVSYITKSSVIGSPVRHLRSYLFGYCHKYVSHIHIVVSLLFAPHEKPIRIVIFFIFFLWELLWLSVYVQYVSRVEMINFPCKKYLSNIFWYNLQYSYDRELCQLIFSEPSYHAIEGIILFETILSLEYSERSIYSFCGIILESKCRKMMLQGIGKMVHDIPWCHSFLLFSSYIPRVYIEVAKENHSPRCLTRIWISAEDFFRCTYEWRVSEVFHRMKNPCILEKNLTQSSLPLWYTLHSYCEASALLRVISSIALKVLW